MIISNYELIEKIAEAPQTIVFKARHKKNPKRLLVLKDLKGCSCLIVPHLRRRAYDERKR